MFTILSRDEDVGLRASSQILLSDPPIHFTPNLEEAFQFAA